MKRQLVAIALLSAGAARGDTVITTENGFSFRLAQSGLKHGKFIDGTPWVVDPGSGVTLTATSPGHSYGRDGFDVNMRMQGDDWPQSLDNRLCDRAGGEKRCPYTEPQLPHTLRAGDSLIKVQSNSSSACSTTSDETCIQDNTVLTVLSSDPTDSCDRPFRPPHSGTEKVSFCFDDVDISASLPTLPDASTDQRSIAYWEAGFGNMGTGSVWQILCGNHSLSNQYCYPMDGIGYRNGNADHGTVYGSGWAHTVIGAALRATQSGTAAQKEGLVWKLIQVGIDTYGAYEAGACFWADGGIQGGHMTPLIFAAHMLNSGKLFAKVQEVGGGDCYQEGGATRASSISGHAVWGRPYNSGCPPKGKQAGNTCSDVQDGGFRLFGPGETSGQVTQKPFYEQTSSDFTMTSYQVYTSIYHGQVALARILGREDEWNDPDFFNYTDRIMGPPWNGFCQNWCSPYLTSMYRLVDSGHAPPPSDDPPPPAPAPLPAPNLR